MARAPFQVLILPYRKAAAGEYEFAVFSRSDYDCWQGIAGGGVLRVIDLDEDGAVALYDQRVGGVLGHEPISGRIKQATITISK